MTVDFETVEASHGPSGQKTREVLTQSEVSQWLGISEPTLSRHRRTGTGPAFVRLSARRVGYRRGAVEAWLRERESV